MTSPAPVPVPVDVVAILADLQQQVSDLTGVAEAQQRTLTELSRIVQAQDHALRQLLPNSPLLADLPAAGAPSAGPRPAGV